MRRRVRSLTADRRRLLYTERVPHLLELFYSPHCISCPDARRAVHDFASGRQDITIIEREVEAERELARRYQLVATPALVIDGEVVLYGIPRAAALAARLDGAAGAHADPGAS